MPSPLVPCFRLLEHDTRPRRDARPAYMLITWHWHLLAILAACRGLRKLSARSCVGFDDEDEEVLRCGARIQRFDVGGSKSKLVEDLGLLWIAVI